MNGRKTINEILIITGRGKRAIEDYRGLFPNISGETARLDFIDLVNKDILKKVGRTKGVYYILSPKLSPIYPQKSKIEGHTEDKKT